MANKKMLNKLNYNHTMGHFIELFKKKKKGNGKVLYILIQRDFQDILASEKVTDRSI